MRFVTYWLHIAPNRSWMLRQRDSKDWGIATGGENLLFDLTEIPHLALKHEATQPPMAPRWRGGWRANLHTPSPLGPCRNAGKELSVKWSVNVTVLGMELEILLIPHACHPSQPPTLHPKPLASAEGLSNMEHLAYTSRNMFSPHIPLHTMVLKTDWCACTDKLMFNPNKPKLVHLPCLSILQCRCTPPPPLK